MDDTVCAAARNLLGIHTHTWLTRASDGHPLCDEDEEVWPCSSVIVAQAILDAQGQEARARLLKQVVHNHHVLDADRMGLTRPDPCSACAYVEDMIATLLAAQSAAEAASDE